MFRLNSNEDNTVNDVLCFYHNFTMRGHMEEMLQFLFLEEIFNSRTFMKKNDVEHD